MALPMKVIPILHDIFRYLSLFVVIPQMHQIVDLYVQFILFHLFIHQTLILKKLQLKNFV